MSILKGKFRNNYQRIFRANWFINVQTVNVYLLNVRKSYELTFRFGLSEIKVKLLCVDITLAQVRKYNVGINYVSAK